MVTRKDICNLLIQSVKMRINGVYGMRIMSIYERGKRTQYNREIEKMNFRNIMDCIAVEMIERGEY